ncbi:MAG: hypothetical protein A3F26_00220 [Candidatus Ryanbacteria bacterium RIFCSPHIGHO2_12_FULL_47_12b]|uniref:Uncharacterized protein n=2 Tax=Candidatus Ryaniibacteriota TaxID=1817914 RepID=A0A1G2H4A9_9BACT|nr:MAG: hypothetical protein A3C83_02740 [Candidatus Ryanbacteria bacterium RIFCSPHIGHO2_02_FULL_47_25]OGZ51356.1 MAG: hypothetical protein A3A29_01965 [Candidatus Ryanbacteria bacterium RIFCSPLOWO2_01_FULL_47_79]OGZ51834.1 MAG: hypothetical protein A3F26_00220 [Candidatus Ryanbacteria bacterium RIFCSPHIGHO2_12_FULL_47_12b]OGZ54834.1 MAG: hypothetical protein A3J04_02420 [Candidatus Ryanbacteria bacterium RIFCSPLOWO2_02_FULL_47_14]OGZ57297.1 MAG: hypothetical protein A3G60_01470 [Candidatus Rya
MQYGWEFHREVDEFQRRNRLVSEVAEFPHMMLTNVRESIEELLAFRPDNSEEAKREHSRRVGQVLYHLVRYSNSRGIILDHALSHFLVGYSAVLRGRWYNGAPAP